MERNLLVLQGTWQDITRGVPTEVQPLFREQFCPELFYPRFAHLRTTATLLALHTVCYRDGDNYLLPKGSVTPEQGAVVRADQLTQLPALAQLQPVEFPTYVHDLLLAPRVQDCILEAAKVASGRLAPHYYGEEATRAMLTDITLGAVAAEERYPGLLHSRLARPPKQFRHWLVWLGRNANDMRRERRQPPTLSLEESLFCEKQRGNIPATTDVAEDYDEQLRRNEQREWAAAQARALRVLAPAVVQALDLVGETGSVLHAAQRLGVPEAQVYDALREARVFLQARALCEYDLTGLAAEKRAVLTAAATAGLRYAAERAQRTPRWVLQTLRDVQGLLEARALLQAGAERGVALAEEMTNILGLIAEEGPRQAAATLGVNLGLLQEVLEDAREKIAAHGAWR